MIIFLIIILFILFFWIFYNQINKFDYNIFEKNKKINSKKYVLVHNPERKLLNLINSEEILIKDIRSNLIINCFINILTIIKKIIFI